jgi:predicted HicB family RNase H-like nuclease
MPSKKTGHNEIVTSLRVNPELWKLAKIEAVKQGITLGEFVDKSLKRELNIEPRGEFKK